MAPDPAGSPSRWFRRGPNANTARLRLVCLPHAGGAATFFHSWAGAFGSDIEVLAARYPGRQDRIAEPCAQSMSELADAAVDAGSDAAVLEDPGLRELVMPGGHFYLVPQRGELIRDITARMTSSCRLQNR